MNRAMNDANANHGQPGAALAALITWLPAFGVMAVIFRLSSQSSFGGPGWVSRLAAEVIRNEVLLGELAPLLMLLDRYGSWGAHFGFYALLALAFWWAVRRQWPTMTYPAWTVFGLTLLYGLSDEIHQSFVPGRAADWRDVVTDAAGAAAALLLIKIWKRW